MTSTDVSWRSVIPRLAGARSDALQAAGADTVSSESDRSFRAEKHADPS